ncbi:MAG: universal stress protein [Nitrosopumilus sp. CG10_big_fil_rev_8_21_14_0_10_33_7]|nr:MAG: universal stress protein [Nitrosopumilus sp. CG10_big_fil_rev_8_21_14_0_10_33_7]
MLKNRFKKILVPLDGSLNSIRGLNEAISLARLGSSQITGIHVLPVYPKNLIGTFDTYVTYKSKLAKEFFEKAKTSAARHGIEFSQEILFGNDMARLITNYAKTSKMDIIILGSRGKGDPKAGFLGSVSNGILYSSKIPVLIVK